MENITYPYCIEKNAQLRSKNNVFLLLNEA